MILPTKHILPAQSLIGAGTVILKQLNRPKTISILWDKVNAYPEIQSFTRFILVLDMLYVIDAIELNDGNICRKTK